LKNVVEVMDQNGNGVLYLEKKFLRTSETKIKETIFLGPQIREIMRHSMFGETSSEV
jgi:hypothetical protein